MKIISFNICPFVQRVAALLEAKELPYEIEFISLQDKPQWFLDISPNGQVPVLVTDNGHALFESDAIVEYLEEAYPPLQPGVSLEDKATNRAWSYLASKNYLIQCSAQRSPDEATFSKQAAKLDVAFDRIEKKLGDTPFFGGDKIGLVDVTWLVLLHRVDIIEKNTGYDFIGDRPKLKSWQKHLIQTGLAEKSVPVEFEQAFSDFYLSDKSILGRCKNNGGCQTDSTLPEEACCSQSLDSVTQKSDPIPSPSRNSPFDTAPAKTGDTFIRHDPEFLNMVFGTEQVTPLWVADMDFAVANPIQKELLRLANRGQFAYEFNSQGVFEAISNWFIRRHDLTLGTGKFEQVSGVLTAIAMLIRELTDPGDSVLMQVPAYHQFGKVITAADRRIVKSSLRRVDGSYEMDYVDLEEKLSAPEVKAMILCNPHNPVGRVWRRDELEKLVSIANRCGVTIISDEIHADIIYSGHRFTSLMAVDQENHVSVIGSPAKTFGMHSISNGYIYTGNEDLLQRFKKTADSMYLTHGNAFTTFATIAAYDKGEAWVDELLTYLEGTVTWINQFLNEELPAIKMSPVEGTYQVWLDCSATGLEGDELKDVLGESGFGATPGIWFDEDAAQFIRVNIAAPRADIEIAFKQFKTVLDRIADERAKGIAPVIQKTCSEAPTNSCC